MVKSLILRKMLVKNKKAYTVFKKLKKYAMDNSDLNYHRWYEFYVEIKYVKVLNFYDSTPKIFFKKKVLEHVLEN